MRKHRIWIADDHQLILDGLRVLLSTRPDLEVVGESNDGLHLLESLDKHAVDLIISDLRMPGMEGFELMYELKNRFPETPVLVLSMSDELELIRRLFHAEVEGFILKNSGKQALFEAIDALLAGHMHYERTLLTRLLTLERKKEANPAPDSPPLSAREMEVLQLILAEKTSKEIGDQLFISKQTVDTHRIHIYEKTGVRTVVGLVKLALERGWA